MKLALLGFGAMGKLIAARAADAGMTVTATLSSRDNLGGDARAAALAPADVVIDFSVAAVVIENVRAAMAAKRPIVIGTTGWNEHLAEARQIVTAAGGAMVFGANFSVGVNIFYRIAAQASALMSRVEGYEAFIEEQHHSRKKDAPSGTALKLKSIVEGAIGRDVAVAATRAGHIAGTHRVGFDSRVDQILLAHAARNREGFADGALVAAKWIIGKRGVFEFDSVMEDVLSV
jgi:4-hydroxy-tetrahydrodipicolinate reductase